MLLLGNETRRKMIKQIVKGLMALLCAGAINATELEFGVKYNIGKPIKPFVSISESYKLGKGSLTLKVEKLKDSPIAFQSIGSYPLPDGFSFFGFGKIGVDEFFELEYLLTSAGLTKSIGKGSISLSADAFKQVGLNEFIWTSTLAGSYKINKIKFTGKVYIPIPPESKPYFKFSTSYLLN